MSNFLSRTLLPILICTVLLTSVLLVGAYFVFYTPGEKISVPFEIPARTLTIADSTGPLDGRIIQPGEIAEINLSKYKSIPEIESVDYTWKVLDNGKERNVRPQGDMLQLPVGITQKKYEIFLISTYQFARRSKPGDLKSNITEIAAKSDVKYLELIVGGTPTPPIPPNPTPSTPAPIPGEGTRILIRYITSDLPTIAKEQASVMTAQSVRKALNDACVMGADGKTKEWRIWDTAIVDISAESKIWQDAIKRPFTALPWIIISNGKTGYEGPLPGTIDQTLELIKKWK